MLALQSKYLYIPNDVSSAVAVSILARYLRIAVALILGRYSRSII